MHGRPIILLALGVLLAGTSPLARFQEGMTHYQQGRFAEALTAFEDAQRLKPSASLLRRIAECREKTGDLPGAQRALREVLADPSLTDRPAVEKELARVEALLPPRREPSDAPRAAPLVAAPEPVSAPATPFLPPAPAAAEPGPARATRTLGVVTGIVAGAALVTGTALFLEAKGAARDYQELRRRDTQQEISYQDAQQAMANSQLGLGLLGAGAALGAFGFYLAY